MTVLVVGSVALDSVETPFGKADNVIGGSGTFFSASASHLSPVQLVGVVGDDYPMDQLEPLRARGVDMAGLEQAEGHSFRWRGERMEPDKTWRLQVECRGRRMKTPAPPASRPGRTVARGASARRSHRRAVRRS